MRAKTALSWSGGKDAAMALLQLHNSADYEPVALFTAYDAETERINLHGIPITLIRAQAQALGIHLEEIPLPPKASNEQYESAHRDAFAKLAKDRGVEVFAFGDIYLEHIKEYRDAMAQREGVRFIYPLWGKEPGQLCREVATAGIEATVCAIDVDKLPSEALGAPYDEVFLANLPEGVDPCGENGEFHTFVANMPGFAQAVNYKLRGMRTEDYRPQVNMRLAMLQLEHLPQ